MGRDKACFSRFLRPGVSLECRIAISSERAMDVESGSMLGFFIVVLCFYSPPRIGDFVSTAIVGAIEQVRYDTLLNTLAGYAPLFRGKRVLDFGASSGLSMLALSSLGAGEVWGVEPGAERVDRSSVPNLLHIANTRSLPFSDGRFDFVLCNAVLEHIPQPRTEYIREMWRVLAPGGYLLVNETPNKYLPFDRHTTGLWFVPWLSVRMAERYARWCGWKQADWEHSGWRGLGHWELTCTVPQAIVSQPICRFRHRVLRLFGLPAQLLDPYPEWLLQKPHG